MFQDGSGTRSGSADRGGLVNVGTRGADGRGLARGRAGREARQHPLPLTTLTFTLAVASRREMWNSRAYRGAMTSVTQYVPTGSFMKIPPKSSGLAAQPFCIPQIIPFGK